MFKTRIGASLSCPFNRLVKTNRHTGLGLLERSFYKFQSGVAWVCLSFFEAVEKGLGGAPGLSLPGVSGGLGSCRMRLTPLVARATVHYAPPRAPGLGVSSALVTKRWYPIPGTSGQRASEDLRQAFANCLHEYLHAPWFIQRPSFTVEIEVDKF